MNNKIDDVMITLLKAKEDVINYSGKENVDDTIKGLDNLIVDYTIKNKMSNKEILDCAMSLYDHKRDKSFIEKIKEFSPSKIAKRTKNIIVENRKKKEFRQKYEEEIVKLVKDRLKSMIDEDRKKDIPPKEDTKTKQKDLNKDTILINNGIIDISDNLDKDKDKNINNSILVLDKDLAKIIDVKKAGTFIFQDNDNFFVYRKSDNIDVTDIEKSQLTRFTSLDQAILYSIDDKVTAKDVRNNFDKLKSNYGNLDEYIIGERRLKNSHGNINYVNNSINMNLETKHQTI